MAVIIGFCGINNKKTPSDNSIQENSGFDERINYENAKLTIYIFTLMGFLYAIISLSKYGFSIKSFLNIHSLLEMNNHIAIERYSGNASSGGILNQILLSFTYAAPLAGGSYFPYAKNKREKLLCFITLAPEFVVLFSHNTKAGLIGCIIFWFSGYIVSSIRINGKIKFNIKTIICLGIVFLIICLIMMSSMIFRIGSINSTTVDIVKNKFINYMFGHIGAIDSWINENILHSNLTFGMQTFNGIARYLVGTARIQGVYTDIFRNGIFSTNVFSYFRGIYQDFGVLGSICVFWLFGCITRWAYRAIIKSSNRKATREIVLVISYAFSLYCFVSIFSYTCFIVAFFLFFIYLNVAYISRQKITLPKIRFVIK